MLTTTSAGILCAAMACSAASTPARMPESAAPWTALNLQDDVAQSQPAPPPDLRPKTLEFKFEAAIWLPRLGGTTQLDGPDVDEPVSLDLDLDLHDLEATPVLEFSILKKKLWQVELSGFAFSTSTEGEAPFRMQWGDVDLARGEDYRAAVDIQSAALQTTVWLWQPIAEWSESNPDNDVDLWLGPTFAARWIGLQQKLTDDDGSRSEADEDWLTLGVGPQMHFAWRCRDSLPWLDELVVDASGTIGPALGDGTGAAWQLKAGISAVFAQSFSLSFGYRLFELNADGDDFEADLGLEGLYFSGAIRF